MDTSNRDQTLLRGLSCRTWGLLVWLLKYVDWTEFESFVSEACYKRATVSSSIGLSFGLSKARGVIVTPRLPAMIQTLPSSPSLTHYPLLPQ